MKKKLLILLGFFILLFFNTNSVNADVCNPYTCAGSNSYLRVDNCKWSGAGTSCLNDGTTPSVPFDCDQVDELGVSTCTGTAEGVNGCLGLTASGGSPGGCRYCDGQPQFDDECNNKGQGDTCGSGAYTGTCDTCTDVTYPVCPAPADGDRMCCGNLIPTPTPTPPPNCGNGSCGAGETCSTCSADCGSCSSPSCTVTTSPSSATIEIDGLPLTLQANVTNIQNGSISDVGFNPSNSNISISPAFDSGSPYTTDITPEIVGGTTLTTTVYMGGATIGCSTTTIITVDPCNDMEIPNTVDGILADGQVSGDTDTSSGNINLTWNDPGISGTSNIDYYEIKIWDKAQGTAVPATCDASTSCVAHQTASKIESYSAPASITHGTDIYVSIRAVNDGCTGIMLGNWSSVSSYDLVSIVSGNFYNDPTATPDGFNNCSSAVTTSIDLSTYIGSDVTGSLGGYDGSPGTSYSISTTYAPTLSWPNFGFNVTLAIDNSSDPENSITCACPVGSDPFTCQHTDTASPATEHFYVSAINLSNGPWWQAVGGNVYGTNSFVSNIPQTCADEDNTLICKPDLITQNADLDTDSAGIPMSGTIIDTNGFNSERGANDPRANDTDHDNIIRENYAYLSREVDLGAADTISGTITSLPSGATPDSDNTQIYFSNTDLTIDFSSNQNIPNGTKIIIFVNGNLTFSSTPDTSMITIDQGGFFSAIASGNITFDESIGNTSATDISSNIEGVFIADGSININGYSDDALIDNKFVGEGTFVGWSTFNMSKDYDNTTNPLQKELNNLNPAEVFIFRPDFNLSIPEIMKRPSMVWQEVN